MLWILIAAAVCAGDLLVKHYIDTHKDAWMDERQAKDADGGDNSRYWCVGRRIDGIAL